MPSLSAFWSAALVVADCSMPDCGGLPPDAAEHIAKLLRDIQQSLYDRAKKFRDERIVTANTLDEFKALFPMEKDEDAGGGEQLKFVYAHWDGTRETEDRVQAEYKATIRCLPFDGPQEAGTCIFTGKPSARRVVFARAY